MVTRKNFYCRRKTSFFVNSKELRIEIFEIFDFPAEKRWNDLDKYFLKLVLSLKEIWKRNNS